MNGRQTLFCVALLVCLVSLRHLSAATLPQPIRQTSNGPVARVPVKTLLDGLVPKLAANDPAAQQQARDAISAEVAGTGATLPSAVFLDVYADVLNTALLPLAKSEDVRVRLNAAIVATRVAAAANNARLTPITVQLLDDSSDSVVFWALKGSRSLMTPVLSGPNAKSNPLIPAFVAATKKHIKSGPMIQAAYEALRVPQGPGLQPSVVQVVVDAAQTLMRLRLDQYKDGIPDMAAVEISATSFLVEDKIWKAQTAAQQMQTIQLIYDLVNFAAAHVDGASLPDKQELAQIVKREGGSFMVVGQWMNLPAIEPVARQLTTVSANTSQDDVFKRIHQISPVLRSIPAFKELKEPTTQP